MHPCRPFIVQVNGRGDADYNSFKSGSGESASRFRLRMRQFANAPARPNWAVSGIAATVRQYGDLTEIPSRG